MLTISVSEARAELPALLDRVAQGEEVTITRHGRQAAVLVRPDTLRARRAQAALSKAAEVRDLLDRARDTPLSEVKGLSVEYAEALAADIRADRDAT